MNGRNDRHNGNDRYSRNNSNNRNSRRRIRTQAFLFFEDAWQNRWSFLLGLVQVLLALLLTGYMVSLAQTGLRTIGAFEQLQSLGNVWHISCIAEAGQIQEVTNDDGKAVDFEAIYRYIGDMEDTETFTADASLKIFLDDKDAEAEKLAADVRYGTAAFQTLRVTKGFFDAFLLQMGMEKEQVQERFRRYAGDDVMPVLLGDSYRSARFEDVSRYHEGFFRSACRREDDSDRHT